MWMKTRTDEYIKTYTKNDKTVFTMVLYQSLHTWRVDVIIPSLFTKEFDRAWLFHHALTSTTVEDLQQEAEKLVAEDFKQLLDISLDALNLF